jgi:hypothetical protein
MFASAARANTPMNTTAAAVRFALALTMSLLRVPSASAQSTCPLLGIDSATTTTSTLWDINTSTGVASNPRTVSGFPNRPPLTIAFAPNGVLYGVSLGGAGSPASGMLFTILPSTGATTFVANLTQHINVEGDIAIDPTTGILYALDGIGPLFTIHTSTGFCAPVGTLPLDLPGGADYSGLGFDSSGQLWAWSQFGQVLRRVNKTNGAIQSTIALAPSPGGAVGDIAFDFGTGKCFLGGNPTGGILSTVDVNTGAVTGIGSTAPMAGVWSLAFDPRNCAKVATQGKGCTNRYASFHEVMTAAAMDLAGLKVSATFTGSGYVITTAPGAGFFLPVGLAPLLLGNDTQVSAGTLGLWVGSNGWVARGPGNSNSPLPYTNTLLNQPNTQISAWTDLDPSDPFGGRVYYDEPAPGVGQVTWDGVLATGTTSANSIQITWNTLTDDWSVEFGALGLGNPQVWLCGWSPSGPSADPGPSDISTFGGSPHSIDLVDTLPLTLAANGRPIQSATATPFNLVTSNIDSTALMHVGWLGLQRPGLPLVSLGLPNDCFLHSTLDVVLSPNLFPGASQTWTALTLPALPPSFSGFLFNCQAATFTGSGIGPTTRVSNGLKCVVGTL